MNLPFSKDLHFLEKWLEPTLYGNKHKLASLAASCGSWRSSPWSSERSASPQRLRSISRSASGREGRVADPARGWRYDEAVSDFMGGPGRKGFDLVAWFDATIVDGIVNGTGRWCARPAGLRPCRPVWSELRRTRCGRCGGSHRVVPREDDLLMSSLFAACRPTCRSRSSAPWW